MDGMDEMDAEEDEPGGAQAFLPRRLYPFVSVLFFRGRKGRGGGDPGAALETVLNPARGQAPDGATGSIVFGAAIGWSEPEIREHPCPF